jgi:hypothetical protein
MRTGLLLLAGVAMPVAALADTTLSFELLPAAANQAECLRWSTTFEKPFTLVVTGDKATLTTGGGFHLALVQSGPDQYHGIFMLHGEKVDHTADVAARTLTLHENSRGCRWSAKAQ